MGSAEHYRSLPVPLTEEQKEQRTQDLIRRLDVIEEIEERKKASNDEYKSQVQREIVTCGQLRRELKQGYTMEEIKCDDIMDWAGGVVTTIRLDTKEVVSEREITETERQMNLDEVAQEETESAEIEPEPQTTEQQIGGEEQLFEKDDTKKADDPEDT